MLRAAADAAGRARTVVSPPRPARPAGPAREASAAACRARRGRIADDRLRSTTSA